MKNQSTQRLELVSKIFNVREDNFESLALEIFKYQYTFNEVYRTYVNALNTTDPKTVNEIPFLPIQFFKSHRIVSSDLPAELIFKSSGTTSTTRATHHVLDHTIYEKSFLTNYENAIGNPENQIIIGLLPSYLEQGESSLIYMVDKLIQRSSNSYSGFYLDDYPLLITKIDEAKNTGKKIVLFGVSYALLDFAEYQPNLNEVIIIETGGMKGKRKEMSKFELHETLKKSFNTNHIASEYGMTELLSQGYSLKNEIFHYPNWMKIMIRQVSDPFFYVKTGKTGGINVIDLANIDSCSFIETQDLGKEIDSMEVGNGFHLMGRFDHSDVRGCNLLVQ
jgi:hypothetical protein